MTFDAVGWSGPDLGLDRTFDLSRSTLRTRTVRRRVLVGLVLVATLGSIVAVQTVWPDAVRRPLFELPYTATLVGIGLMCLALVVMLVGAATMARAGGNPIDNHDPLRDLSGADRAWVRARVAASAPVTPAQHPVVAHAALWMARQKGTVPIYAGLTLEGLGMAIGSPGIVTFLIGLLLVVEGLVLAGVAVVRARSARHWLSLYTDESGPSPVMLS